MCYINGVRVSLQEFITYKQIQKELKEVGAAIANRPAHKGFDYGDWPVIKPSLDGKDWDVVAMEWGFIPSYLNTAQDVYNFRHGYTDASGRFRPPLTTLNAMGEELLKPGKMFRDAALHRRCLILSSGFYEHRHIFPIGKKGLPLKTAVKYPYHITVKDTPVFMMAGIYQPWTDKETGETKDSFAIITTDANPLMKQIHNSKNRMPTLLSDQLADEWSNPDLTEERITQLATNQFPVEKMKAHTVAKDFLANVDPTEEFIYPDLPDLVY
ncbi:MAG: SOS response-associated peptidase family protein [Ferruginibacter sp.]